tara:strand:- start:51 stop:188 length:138 start_codon:yes stop_codon:yes gene_type:complete
MLDRSQTTLRESNLTRINSSDVSVQKLIPFKGLPEIVIEFAVKAE